MPFMPVPVYHHEGEGLAGPPVVVAVLAAFLLWSERKAFAHLLTR
jgi:hypothetical protein